MHRILIIDDEEKIRKVLAQGLRYLGFDTIEADNGRAGVELAIAYVPDLIVSDINMEGFDGNTALAAVRFNPITCTIPVILMTGRPDEQGRRSAMVSGADDYLAKPFTVPEIVASIRTQISKRELIRIEALKQRETTRQAVVPIDSESNPEDVQPTAPVDNPALPPAAKLSSETAAAPPDLSDGPKWVELYLRILNRFHPNLGNTAMRAMVVCRALAQHQGMTPSQAQNLCWAAALHDIALLGSDPEVVGRWLQDSRRVSQEEEAFFRRHPVESAEMLQDLPVFQEAGEIIRFHHELWDGSGYPHQLRGEAIPWPARLLTAVLGYANQHTLGTPAIKAIEAESGRRFDPLAVRGVLAALALTQVPAGIREILFVDIRPGQVLAREIYNCMGAVLVVRGRELGEPLIRKLMAINRSTPLDQRVLVYCQHVG